MTRKQALLLGISILGKNQKHKEIVSKLTEICNTCYDHIWYKDEVFDAIEQFRIEHNRLPNISDFRSRNLPSKSSIKNIFGLSMKEFMDKYFPERKSIAAIRCKAKSIKYWSDDFVETYKKIGGGRYVPKSVYDSLRTPGSIQSSVLMKHLRIDTYNDLIAYLGLNVSMNISINRKK